MNARFVGSHTETPLHWAASSDDVEAATALLDAGSDIEAPGAVLGGGSPLAEAVGVGQWQIARLLVDRGRPPAPRMPPPWASWTGSTRCSPSKSHPARPRSPARCGPPATPADRKRPSTYWPGAQTRIGSDGTAHSARCGEAGRARAARRVAAGPRRQAGRRAFKLARRALEKLSAATRGIAVTRSNVYTGSTRPPQSARATSIPISSGRTRPGTALAATTVPGERCGSCARSRANPAGHVSRGLRAARRTSRGVRSRPLGRSSGR